MDNKKESLDTGAETSIYSFDETNTKYRIIDRHKIAPDNPDNSNTDLSRPLRIVLYSHDTMGLGHMRRNLLIAKAVTESHLDANILMITGRSIATAFAMPAGVDCLTLPALRKQVDGGYAANSLALSLEDICNVRAKTIRGAIEAFQPDVLIVDNVPRGANQELDETLEYLRSRGTTYCVLGLRDILDEPFATQREWQSRANEESIRNYYDAVWVYGDRAVYDSVHEYRFSEKVAEKVSYTGYFDRRLNDKHSMDQAASSLLSDLKPSPGQLILCMAGGGQDGEQLAETFSRAELPAGATAVILTGPFMPDKVKAVLHARAVSNTSLRILEFHSDPALLLNQADRVVAMGGYNTISEILSFEKRALIVPRVMPRREQMIRAERLKQHGLLELCHPDDLTPGVIAEWLARDVAHPRNIRRRIDFNGLSRLPQLLSQACNVRHGGAIKRIYKADIR